MRSIPHLIFVRHGETDWNVAGRLQGQRDIPLNERGRDQAAAVGRALGRIIGAGAASHALSYIASPLARARQTMELARAALDLPAQAYATDARLMELSFGSWEGLTWPEVQARAPEAAFARETGKWNFAPPGGESYAMLARRIAPWLAELGGDTLVVAHGGVARVLLALIGGVAHETASVADIWQGRLLVFESGGFVWL